MAHMHFSYMRINNLTKITIAPPKIEPSKLNLAHSKVSCTRTRAVYMNVLSIETIILSASMQIHMRLHNKTHKLTDIRRQEYKQESSSNLNFTHLLL